MSEIPSASPPAQMPGHGFATWPQRAFRSLRSQGLRVTARRIRANLSSARFDRQFGTDTNSWVDLAGLEVIGNSKVHATFCQPIRPTVFDDAIDKFRIPLDGTFVDFGAGAGRALLLAARAGFKRVVGIEFAPSLCTLAKRNIELFRRKTGLEFSASVLNLDAMDYPITPDDTVFFLFNPFGPEVLRRVFERIRQSYEVHPRPIHVVYANAVHRSVVDDDPFWVIAGESDGGGFETFVHYRPR